MAMVERSSVDILYEKREAKARSTNAMMLVATLHGPFDCTHMCMASGHETVE